MRRIIFTLLYDRGRFMLSRNFRLQEVGDVRWLFTNYDFSSVSRGLDELMVIDVSQGSRDSDCFANTVQQIAERCFIPLTVGGGITSFDVAQRYMRCGADKLLVNTAFETDPQMVSRLADHFGRQCIVAGIDFRTNDEGMRVIYTQNGQNPIDGDLSQWVDRLQQSGAGEIMFQSMDRDGTGMGLDLSVVSDLKCHPEVPCIVMGGVGRGSQIIEGLKASGVDAVATANLFNFIGSAFLDVRSAVRDAGVAVPEWSSEGFARLKNSLIG